MGFKWICNWRATLSRIYLLLILLVASTATAYEEPEYEVLHQTEEYEIREYESYLVAQTRVSGDFDRTGNTAFQRLAGYIFGNNQQLTENDPDDSESGANCRRRREIHGLSLRDGASL